MLLFLSQAGDLHTDWVETECQERQIPYHRFHTAQFPQHVSLTIHANKSEFGGVLHFPDREVPLTEVSGIWFRRPEPPIPHPDTSPELYEFVAREAHLTLDGLFRALWDRRWVNPLHCDTDAQGKIYQLHLARQLGFQVPRTLVTNNPTKVRDFFYACGQHIIQKTLFPTVVKSEEGNEYCMHTTQITERYLLHSLDAVRVSPCMFQELIPKKYELRINVIGQYVWAAAVYSQHTEKGKIDYRLDMDNCDYVPVLIPHAIEKLCVALTHRLGLRMSNIDMILTPDSEYVFLEANPNGQWAWIEQETGFPLATALVDELLGVNTLADHPYLKERSLNFTPQTKHT